MRTKLIGAIALALIAALVVWLVVGRKHATTPVAATGSPVVARGALLRSGAASIAGTVRDPKGAAIADATVCADVGTDAGVCVKTSARGAYMIAALPPGTYEVAAVAPKYRPARYHSGNDSVVTPVAVAAGERRANIDVVLSDGAVALTGTVVDVNGGPIAHAMVRARVEYWRDEKWYPPIEADANGAFTLWVREGGMRVEARADGYAPAEQYASAPGSVTLLMTPESSISGTVVDGSGAPVIGADVSAVYIGTRVTTRTDDRGAFRVGSLEPGRYEISATSEHGHGELPGSVLVGLAENVTGIVVRMDPAARISGRVVMPDGHDCPGASVLLRDMTRLGEEMPMLRGGDGVFVASGVMAGTHVPRVRCPGFYEKKAAPLEVTTKDHENLVWKVHAGATLHGHVRDATGAPLDHVEVGLDGIARDTFSLVDGTYRLEGVEPGTYTLVATTKSAGKATQEIVVTGTETIERDLTIEEGGIIRGSVRDTNGRVVVGQGIQASTEEGGEPKAGDTGADGSFELKVRPGAYQVYPARDFQPPLADKQPVKITAGQVVTLSFVVPPQTGVIRGDVKDTGGKPIGDAYVSVHRQSGFDDSWEWSFNDRPVLTTPEGTFEVGGLGPGVYTAIARRRGGGEVRMKGIELGAEVHLVLPVMGSIAGTLAFADGTAPAEVQLTLRDKPREMFRSERFYHSSGVFEISDLPPGEYTMAAMAPDGFGVGTVTLGPGENKTGVTIAMERFVTVSGRVVDAFSKQPLPAYYVIPRTKRALLGTHADPDDVNHQTDATGRFRIQAPTGPVQLQVMSQGMRDYTKCHLSVDMEITGPTDVGDIPIVQARRTNDAPKATLGFSFGRNLVVDTIKEPAISAGLKKGDVVTAVDGVAGETLKGCQRSLIDVPIGTTVKLTLGSGKTISIVAVDPNAPIEF